MIEAIHHIIRKHAQDHNVINNGFVETSAQELAALFESAISDCIMLQTSAENILSGIMANPTTGDTYDQLDVCNESVELAHTLLMAVKTRVEDNANKRVSVVEH